MMTAPCRFFTERYGQRTSLDTELAALEEPPPAGQRPQLAKRAAVPERDPHQRPADLTERLLDAFNVQTVYNRGSSPWANTASLALWRTRGRSRSPNRRR